MEELLLELLEEELAINSLTVEPFDIQQPLSIWERFWWTSNTGL